MSRVRIKICGITSLKDLHIAIEAGVDAVGFVVDVPQSQRNLPLDEAKKLIKATPIFVETVAVTVSKGIKHIEKINRKLNTNTIQIHGPSHLHEEIRARFPNVRLIGSIQAKSDLVLNDVLEAANTFDAILVDSYVPGKFGGTGKTHDWDLSRRVKEAIYPKPLILSGGLKPENVKEAIYMVKPYAVDVSSGVESEPGVKDRGKVFEFVKNAKEVEI